LYYASDIITGEQIKEYDIGGEDEVYDSDEEYRVLKFLKERDKLGDQGLNGKIILIRSLLNVV